MSDETKANQVFVIQMQGVGVNDEAWVDVATITLPAHTPRRIAIKEALKIAKVTAGEKSPKLRALDVKSAEVFEPKAVQPPMEWTL